jgi:hypothetical protein
VRPAGTGGHTGAPTRPSRATVREAAPGGEAGDRRFGRGLAEQSSGQPPGSFPVHAAGKPATDLAAAATDHIGQLAGEIDDIVVLHGSGSSSGLAWAEPDVIHHHGTHGDGVAAGPGPLGLELFGRLPDLDEVGGDGCGDLVDLWRGASRVPLGLAWRSVLRVQGAGRLAGRRGPRLCVFGDSPASPYGTYPLLNYRKNTDHALGCCRLSAPRWVAPLTAS